MNGKAQRKLGGEKQKSDGLNTERCETNVDERDSGSLARLT